MNLKFWNRPPIVNGFNEAFKNRSYSQKRQAIFQIKCMKAIGVPDIRLEDFMEILILLKDYPLPIITWSKYKEITFTWISPNNKIECFLNERGKLAWLGTFSSVYSGCGEEYYQGKLPDMFKDTLSKVFSEKG